MKKIVWFTTWYPSEVDVYNGDFIERHARATAPFAQISLLHVVKVDRDPGTTRVKQIHKLFAPDGEETITYYSIPKGLVWPVHQLISFLIYLRIHHRYLKKYIAAKGMPDGIHVHIGFRAGVAAWLASKRYGIPYIVSEQWTGICPEASPNFRDLAFSKRLLWKKVMRAASANTAVSAYLGNQMARLFSLGPVAVVPNVVDGNIFVPGPKRTAIPRFVHISNGTPQKNIPEILLAAAELKNQLPIFEMLFIGGNGHTHNALVDSLALKEYVRFLPAMPQSQLRDHIQQSTALILYSLYETFGCVVIEANACGCPVVVSDIPVFGENVQEGLNGIRVPLHQPSQLASALLALAAGVTAFNPEHIRSFALRNYSFEKIGRAFSALYDRVFVAR